MTKHTDTSRIADLRFQVSEKMPINHSDLSCLFDRIEALTAENERLRATVGDRMEFYLDRIEALNAENKRLREALREMFEVVCGETGFAQAVRADSGFAYPWPALDLAEAKARAALGDTQ